MTGYLYTHHNIGPISIIESIVYALKSFAFEINTKNIGELIENEIWFTSAFYIAYILAVYTVLASALSLIKEYLLNMIRVNQIKRKETDIVIGLNETALHYTRQHKHKTILWIDHPLVDSENKALQNERLTYIKLPLNDVSIKKILYKNVRYNFIAFEGQENKYQSYIDLFIKINNEFKMMFLYLESKYQEMNVIRDQYLAHKNHHPHLYINTFSRYELLSRKFVTENTIPKYLPSSFFHQNRSIKNEYKINVFLLGYGKVNASLFSMFCQNNQLVTTINNKLVAKPVSYYIIDKNDDALNDKRIDYLLNNYLAFESDLPRVESMCDYHKIIGDLNSNKTIDDIKRLANQPSSFNFFIVSYGDDFENIELASWIKPQFDEKNSVIMCRVKKARMVDSKIICFGNEVETLSHSYIVDEELQQLAKDVNKEYATISSKILMDKEDVWNKLNQIELFSNYYAAMNLRFKLNILGFDITKDTSKHSISRDEFLAIYNQNTPTNHHYMDYFLPITRNVIAYSEKLRWNAFHLFNDYRPMRLSSVVLNEDKTYIRKDIHKKLHVCLTSHEGLDIFHHEIIKKFHELNINVEVDDIETYSFDYMAFDNPKQNLIDTLIEQGYILHKL